LSKEICALIEDNKLRTQLRQAAKRQAKEAASTTSATSTSDEGAPVPTDSGEEAA
jgi:hypothetical protein